MLKHLLDEVREEAGLDPLDEASALTRYGAALKKQPKSKPEFLRMYDASATEMPGANTGDRQRDWQVQKAFLLDATKLAGKDLAQSVANLELVAAGLKSDAGALLRGGKHLATRDGYAEVDQLIKDLKGVTDRLSNVAKSHRRKILGNLR